jgi:hypothetical protein
MTPMAQSVEMGRMTPRVRALRDLATIRTAARAMLACARAGKSNNFKVNDAQIAVVADYVAQITRENYPDLNIPFHSRWRHFEVPAKKYDGADHAPRNLAYELIGDPRRAVGAGTKLEWLTKAWDLVMVSVLLDAGAGDRWTYHDIVTEMDFRRSEGLAIASLRMFQAGIFSATPGSDPLRVDAITLVELDPAELARGFQVTDSNPMTGLEGRASLLRAFGQRLLKPDLGLAPLVRPGELAGVALDESEKGVVSIPDVFAQLLNRFSSMWPGRPEVDGFAMGDVWRIENSAGEMKSDSPWSGYVPFHKLTQWLTYSLAEPLIATGVGISGLDQLTGLPEYRNGGLLLDFGALELIDSRAAAGSHRPESGLIIEWRALTVALLDEIAAKVRLLLARPKMETAQILQGGTWTAGRKIAAEKRGLSAPPPLKIESDGTVF